MSTEIAYRRTRNYEVLSRLATISPAVWSAMADDFAPAREEYRVPTHPDIWYVVVLVDGDPVGFFAFFPSSGVCAEMHTVLLPLTWGETAAAAIRGIFGWMWQHSPFQRIVTAVPSFNRAALRFGLVAGMQQYGVNPMSYLKNGTLHDQILLGVSRPEEA